jgi:hypothetical protein
LIRIPRLFGALFLVPAIVSLILIYTQLHITEFIIKTLRRDSSTIKQQINEKRENNIIRKVLLHLEKPLEDIQVCRWLSNNTKFSQDNLIVPCTIEAYDIALQVTDPANYDASSYIQIFNGHFRRLHICENCSTKIIVNVKKTKNTVTTPNVHAFDVWALALLSLIEFSQERAERYLAMLSEVNKVNELTGPIFLHAEGFKVPIKVNDLTESLGAIAALAMNIIIALWLAVRAHRRILDYFSRSGALLPLVAATGQRDFYTALWYLTGARVGFFLIAALPLTFVYLKRFSNRPITHVFFNGDISALMVWLIALVSGLLLATLISSIADLKHRFSLTSLCYRYVPLAFALLGGAFWGTSFLFSVELMHKLRILLAALPIAGITPTLLAPIFTPDYGVLVTHALLSVALLTIVARANVRWFAAHLEQI